MQGKGAVETNLNGTYAKERLSLNGTLSFSFSKGGFSSPDAAKAAQDVSGKVILKLQYGGDGESSHSAARSEIAAENFSGRNFTATLPDVNAALTLDGSFFLPKGVFSSHQKLISSASQHLPSYSKALLRMEGRNN